MNTYGRMEVWLHHSWPRLLYPRHPLGGPQSRAGRCGEEKNFASARIRTL
jgi:hypothetical protein